ncbi:UvrD-helicase domain-containing protein [candidate division KSB1 bacterium]|nr:UvrD-helicase domain-containing protein [candidate division KSB1 bacterium]NIR72563.1 UvrD-helicase domain-containing protein [candidate division KSB1 bacterium]NIS27315.1 UvrD-helicase domain-containing protein [candidate division KSB1 bacterium]NIT73525.1 UvrD-helicase domain-containing protein [candidate division KSB1 bacterium]NIU28045.1 UvrD-helicase domain-containing protein [candidate division KSB1 bacterium]
MGKTKKTNNPDLLDSLNPVQREAVKSTEGPVLILAGAGSGKTRVLTYRVAYLIQCAGIDPAKILAVTFTNKAAQEMSERILKLTGGAGKGAWIGTFHATCARILRMEGHHLGYDRNFSIFDKEDQQRFIRDIMKEMNISTKEYPPEQIVSRISGAKNSLVSPTEYKSLAYKPFDETVSAVYINYQKRLKENNIMDFDDLLINPILVFDQQQQVLEKYQRKFNYILVDEFQDTNRAQYLLLQRLVAKHRNLCVVGDDDQSIYRWRGADIQNILNLEKDFPDCKVFNLEQNYRSTKHILDAANSVVANNLFRREKALWTTKELGNKVTILEVDNAFTESLMVLNIIQEELSNHARDFSDFAVLYRTNAQSRILEDGLRTAGIPYRVVGGIRFYERKEIKDVLAYLRLFCNPHDSVSFKRIINFPLRGIGERSVKRIEDFARHHSISLLEAAARVEEIPSISPRIRNSISEFYALINKYASLKNEFSPRELTQALVEEIGILRTLKEIGTEESFNRVENVRELLSAVAVKTSNGATLDDFLEEVTLITDIDSWDNQSNAVALMTLHSAKGLEFPTVFIAGLEEGLFPLSRTFLDEDDLEEERRLFYVGATRAQENLYLSWAENRVLYGENVNNLPSRFLDEIEPEFVVRKNLTSSQRNRFSDAEYRHRKKVEAEPTYDDYTPNLYVGCEVGHELFGVGRITRMEGRGQNAKVTVDFYENGTKKLVVKYANLQVISSD